MRRKTDKDSQTQQSDDRFIWGVWMGIMLISVICLPFIVRHLELARTFADMCLTALSLK